MNSNDGYILEKNLIKTIDELKRCKEKLTDMCVDKFRVVSTHALRRAKNKKEIEKAKNQINEQLNDNQKNPGLMSKEDKEELENTMKLLDKLDQDEVPKSPLPRVDAEEVTAQFFDLEARVRNKQQEEQRLLTHLDKTTRQLSEILTIEREISRVRGEIEQMQGRLKLLADQTSLSTIDLTISEMETFVPAVSPTFPTRIARAWNGSTETLLSVLGGLAIFAPAAFPWIAVLALFGAVFLPVTLAIRRRLTWPMT